MEKTQQLLKKNLKNTSKNINEDENDKKQDFAIDKDLMITDITKNYQKFSTKSKNLSEKFDKISQDFDQIYNTVKNKICPNTSNWNNWSAVEFVRWLKFIEDRQVGKIYDLKVVDKFKGDKLKNVVDSPDVVVKILEEFGIKGEKYQKIVMKNIKNLVKEQLKQENDHVPDVWGSKWD